MLDGELDREHWQQWFDVPDEWSRLLDGRFGPVRHAGRLRKLLDVVPARIGFRLVGQETVGHSQLDYATALFHLADQRWRRPLDAWSPRACSRRGAFSSLANHLLAEYPVPEFLAMAWLRDDDYEPQHAVLVYCPEHPVVHDQKTGALQQRVGGVRPAGQCVEQEPARPSVIGVLQKLLQDGLTGGVPILQVSLDLVDDRFWADRVARHPAVISASAPAGDGGVSSRVLERCASDRAPYPCTR